mgnify:CR=1 FL=1
MGMENSSGNSSYQLNSAAVEEMVMSTSGISADTNADGLVVNVIPKEGGNQFKVTLQGLYANNSLEGTNLTADLKARGLTTSNKTQKLFDYSAGIGGPIKKDKTFIFGTYEGLEQRLGVTQISNVLGAGCHGAAGATITQAACPQLTTASATVSPVVANLLTLFPAPKVCSHCMALEIEPTALPRDGKLYLGANPNEPKAGDLRITFRTVPNGPVSIIGRQSGADFAEYQTQAGDKLLMARSGLMSAPDMFKAAEQENRILTWIIRLVGVVIMFIGLVLILKPLVVVADVVPFIGGILGAGAALVAAVVTAVMAPLVIAIAWLWYRPLVSIVAIAIGLAIAFGFRTLAARRSASRSGQPAGAVR